MSTVSILDKETHKRLIEDLPDVLRDANISEGYIHSPLKTHASEDVVEFVKRWPKHKHEGTYGLVICGTKHIKSPEAGLSAVVAALTRNFIRARVVTLQTFMDNDDDDLQEITCLAVPNLLTAGKSSLPDWAFPTLMDKLLVRKLRGRMTLFCAQDFKSIEAVYGTEFARTLKRDFVILE